MKKLFAFLALLVAWLAAPPLANAALVFYDANYGTSLSGSGNVMAHMYGTSGDYVSDSWNSSHTEMVPLGNNGYVYYYTPTENKTSDVIFHKRNGSGDTKQSNTHTVGDGKMYRYSEDCGTGRVTIKLRGTPDNSNWDEYATLSYNSDNGTFETDGFVTFNNVNLVTAGFNVYMWGNDRGWFGVSEISGAMTDQTMSPLGHMTVNLNGKYKLVIDFKNAHGSTGNLKLSVIEETTPSVTYTLTSLHLVDGNDVETLMSGNALSLSDLTGAEKYRIKAVVTDSDNNSTTKYYYVSTGALTSAAQSYNLAESDNKTSKVITLLPNVKNATLTVTVDETTKNPVSVAVSEIVRQDVSYKYYLDYTATDWTNPVLHIFADGKAAVDIAGVSVANADGKKIYRYDVVSDWDVINGVFHQGWDNKNQTEDIKPLTDGAIYVASGGSNEKKHSVTKTDNYTEPTLTYSYKIKYGINNQDGWTPIDMTETSPGVWETINLTFDGTAKNFGVKEYLNGNEVSGSNSWWCLSSAQTVDNSNYTTDLTLVSGGSVNPTWALDGQFKLSFNANTGALTVTGTPNTISKVELYEGETLKETLYDGSTYTTYTVSITDPETSTNTKSYKLKVTPAYGDARWYKHDGDIVVNGKYAAAKGASTDATTFKSFYSAKIGVADLSGMAMNLQLTEADNVIYVYTDADNWTHKLGALTKSGSTYSGAFDIPFDENHPTYFAMSTNPAPTKYEDFYIVGKNYERFAPNGADVTLTAAGFPLTVCKDSPDGSWKGGAGLDRYTITVDKSEITKPKVSVMPHIHNLSLECKSGDSWAAAVSLSPLAINETDKFRVKDKITLGNGDDAPVAETKYYGLADAITANGDKTLTEGDDQKLNFVDKAYRATVTLSRNNDKSIHMNVADLKLEGYYPIMEGSTESSNHALEDLHESGDNHLWRVYNTYDNRGTDQTRYFVPEAGTTLAAGTYTFSATPITVAEDAVLSIPAGFLVTVQWDEATRTPKKLIVKDPNAAPTLYLVGGANGWTLPATETFTYEDGVYRYVLRKSDQNFKISTTPGTADNYDGEDGFNTQCWSYNNGGYGTSPRLKEGEVKTIYDCTNSSYSDYKWDMHAPTDDVDYLLTVVLNSDGTGTITATAIYDAHMPLTSADFAGGRSHYFLVGPRMGEWHLQPEWEFSEVETNDGVKTLSINGGRLIYPTLFGIGKVDTYGDYVNQRYTLYGGQYWITGIPNENSDGQRVEHIGRDVIQKAYANFDAYTTEEIYRAEEKHTYNTDSRNIAFWFNPNTLGEGDENDRRMSPGAFVQGVNITVDDSGEPTDLRFVFRPDGDIKGAETRVFQLCGSDIFNMDYCNGIADNVFFNAANNKDGKNTYIRTDLNGWQEGWIQYDGQGKPYYDAKGKYVYQTVYQDEWFDEHPSYFNVTVGGKPFKFTSKSITFVEASRLDNLAKDPYRDFYKCFTNNGQDVTISNGATISGGSGETAYSFVTSLSDAQSVTANDWTCYVVRDMWMSGEFKIWSGHGGNNENKEGFGGTSVKSRWNGPNGGPINDDRNVAGYDIMGANTTAKVYRNQMNIEKNYTNNGEQQFFNRVILWYSPTLGFQQSFVQFIQETASPAISVRAQEGETAKLVYDWKLINYNESDNTKIDSYTVKRYRVTKEGSTLNGTTENNAKLDGDNVVTIADFVAGGGSFKNTKSFDDPTELNAGTYAYEITVTYVNPTTGEKSIKTARSNEWTIINDQNIYEPEALALQLLELTPGAYEVLDINPKSSIVEGSKAYLTYREEKDGNLVYYLVNPYTTNDNKYHIELNDVNDDNAKYLINNHPELYKWSSDYYVRLLDVNDYRSYMTDLVDRGVILSVPATYGYSVEEVDSRHEIGTHRGIVQCEIMTGKNSDVATGKLRVGAILERQGHLGSGKFTVGMKYKVASEERNPKASAEFEPKVPQPYGLSYFYETAKESTPQDLTVEITAITQSEILPGGVDADNNPTTADVEVVFPVWYDNNTTSRIAPRAFDCLFKFYQPNVTDDILAKYDIVYDVVISNNHTKAFCYNPNTKEWTVPTGELLSDNQVLYSHKTYYDVAQSGQTHPYAFRVKNVSPTTELNPVIEIVNVSYRAKEYDDVDNANFSCLTYNGQSNVSQIEAVSFFDRGTPPAVGQIYLVPIKNNQTQNYEWYYFGHADVNNTGGSGIGGELDDDDDVIMKPSFYHFEACVVDEFGDILARPDDGFKPSYFHNPDYYYGGFREIMYHNPTEQNCYQGGDKAVDDPFIGRIVMYNVPGEYKLKTFLTPVYVFERAPQSSIELGSGENYSALSETGDLSRLAAPRRIVIPEPEFVIMRGEPMNYSTATNADEFDTTGLENLNGYDDAEPEYYNIQGMRITEPKAGEVYIVRRGAKVTKELMR